MIGLDANVVVRFLAQDDDIQSPIVTRLISRLSRDRPGFTSSVVLAEITWALSRSYKSSYEEIARAVEGLLRSAELIIENADAAYRALAIYRASGVAEFSDALIAETAALAGVAETVTFDRGAALGFGMRLLR